MSGDIIMAGEWRTLFKDIIADAGVALTGADQALKVVKGIRDLMKSVPGEVSSEIREKLVDLREQLLTVREQNAALGEALLEAQKKLSQIDDFVAEVGQFSLEEISPNSFAYKLKTPGTAAEKSQCYCAPCFGEKRKSLLQFESRDWHFDTVICPSCGTKARVPNDAKPEVYVLESRRSDGFWGN